jgi:hypothetical protein
MEASGEFSVAASSGMNARFKVGKNGCAAIAWHDGNRPRFAVAYDGENGIQAGVWYSVNESGEFMECEK